MNEKRQEIRMYRRKRKRSRDKNGFEDDEREEMELGEEMKNII